MFNALQRAVLPNPLIHPVVFDELIQNTTSTDGQGGLLTRELAESPGFSLSVSPQRVLATLRSIAGYQRIIATAQHPALNDPAVSTARRNVLASLRRNTAPAVTNAYLDAIDTTLNNFVNKIKLAANTITLTSESTNIPIAITNTTGRAVRVRLVLVANRERPKLELVHPKPFDLPASPVLTTVLVAVRSVSSGDFQIELALESTDGNLQVGTPTVLTLKSSIFGHYGGPVTYGALAFLILWWARHIWKRRRAPKRIVADSRL